jgi:hypothetical protein
VSRTLTTWLDSVRDAVSLPVAILLLFATAGAIGALWYWFPRWVPRRLPRWRPMLAWLRNRRRPSWLRWPGWLRAPRGRWSRWRDGLRRWRRPDWSRLLAWFREWRWPHWLRWSTWRRKRTTEEPDPVQSEPAHQALPAPVELVSLADRLAAQGRYAEAVRERLRAMVFELVTRGLVGHRPDWTVMELAVAVGAAYPAIRPPLDGAGQTFSEIWYAQRPAGAEHDRRMRAFAAQLQHSLEAPG